MSSASSDAIRPHVEFVNDSGERVEVHWIHDNQKVLMGKPTNGQSIALDSAVNHTFTVTNGKMEATILVSDEENQVYIVKNGLVVQSDESSTTLKDANTHDILEECKTKALSLIEKDPQMAMEQLAQCVQTKTARMLELKNEELAFQASIRATMAHMAENYTCADPNRETTEPIEQREWTHKGITRRVGVLHNRPSSQIHIIHDFISDDECEAIRLAAEPKLHRGTVADGKGGSRLSESRKAWQAGIKAPATPGSPILNVKQRLFDYTNDLLHYNMTLPGQEDIMSIQYFGKGMNDTTPDRYTPHCDGDCDGLPHKQGGRVATMVMYCDVPELGGGTNFQHANVFVKPQKGAAAFFSYMNPVTLVKEKGFTTHSGCPVLLGSKRIAVQWMRVGVDEAHPWDSFDTNTVQKKIVEDYL